MTAVKLEGKSAGESGRFLLVDRARVLI